MPKNPVVVERPPYKIGECNCPIREVSAVDIAFFDQPTTNLDDHRRDNLAEQLLNVKGFSQLFVISHDDTFERDTDNVVRVAKENGVSRVEV